MLLDPWILKEMPSIWSTGLTSKTCLFFLSSLMSLVASEVSINTFTFGKSHFKLGLLTTFLPNTPFLQKLNVPNNIYLSGQVLLPFLITPCTIVDKLVDKCRIWLTTFLIYHTLKMKMFSMHVLACFCLQYYNVKGT